MGAQISKAETYVNDIIKAGVSVVEETITEASSPVTQTQLISLRNCHGIKIDTIRMSQYSMVNTTVLATIMNSTDLASKIDSAVKVAAESEALAGFGFSDSVSRAVVNKTIDMSHAIANSTRAAIDTSISQIQSFSCESSTDVNIKMIDMQQTAKAIARLVVQNDNINSIKQEIIDKIDAESKSKTKGYDPMALILLGVAVFAVFTLGSFGLGAKILTSAKFWTLVSGIFTLFASYFVLASFIGTWPAKKIDELIDKEPEIEKKKEFNKKERIISMFLTGAFGLVTAGLMVYIVKSKK